MLAEDETKLFTNLGLTYSQTKVYLALVNCGETTAKRIAVNAKMDRPDVYRVIDGLVKQGFVRKEIQNPVRFKAFPIEEVLATLLKRKQAEVATSKKNANKIIRRYRNKRLAPAESCGCNFFFTLIPGDPDTIDKNAGKIIDNSQTLVDFVCVDIEPRIIGFQPLERFLDKGGKNRILAYNKNTSLAKKVLQAHKKGGIEIRFTPEPPIVALIGDQKEVSITCITNKKGTDLKKIECLYTNSPAIIELAVDYFERLWKQAESF